MRDATADALEALLLRSDRYIVSQRDSLYQKLLHDFLDKARGDSSLRRDGRAAVVMAGPPGAGKGHAVRGRPDLRGYLTINADDVKTLLLEHDVQVGRLDPLLAEQLPDGGHVLPEELASLVHPESTMLADQMRQLALADGFNVIIEGTLQWVGQGPVLARELRVAGYEELELIAVEVPLDVALRQALMRWWGGRNEPTQRGGGRFTPSGAVRAMYPVADSPHSICLRRAVDMFNLRDVNALERATLTIHNRHGDGLEEARYEQVRGEYTQAKPDVDSVLQPVSP